MTPGLQQTVEFLRSKMSTDSNGKTERFLGEQIVTWPGSPGRGTEGGPLGADEDAGDAQELTRRGCGLNSGLSKL